MSDAVSLSAAEVRAIVDTIFDAYRPAGTSGTVIRQPATAKSLVYQGKLYEALVVTEVLRQLNVHEGYTATLTQGSAIFLRSSPGPIDPRYAHFALSRPGGRSLELWTDVEFLGLSHHTGGRGPSPAWDEYHELDIVVVPAGTAGRPKHADIRLGVECKRTTYRKDMLRAALGVRRELSLLSDPQATAFRRWPAPKVPADPPSCLMVYSTDPRVASIGSPGATFGIGFVHLPWP